MLSDKFKKLVARQDKADRLREIREEILGLVQESRGILAEAGGDHQRLAEAFWLRKLNDALTSREGDKNWTMEDSVGFFRTLSWTRKIVSLRSYGIRGQ